MIKNIFFDIGGVLIDIHPDRCVQYWANSADLSLDEIKTVFSDEVYHAYETGQLSDREFFLAFKDALPQPCCLKESDFWRGWQKLLGEESPVSKLLKPLSSQYNIWLLSNTNPRHIQDELDLRYTFPKRIDGAVYSFDAGARKPDPAIYKYALKVSGAVAGESLFIDDLLPNIEAAKVLGWEGIHYQNINQLKTALNQVKVVA
ncbi:MAG: HAD family phosphatase [Candidatus Marinimicrobia bacterium]|jgi:putative hydrolase of the HAD superfamily|nr:HAD family phosphatase [Candidatus Neomarinimicrobiota bacterium]|tara:strand:- start:943 stop:1551 length:609 start_codon:yes stop_codon:yes gene_type:complete